MTTLDFKYSVYLKHLTLHCCKNLEVIKLWPPLLTEQHMNPFKGRHFQRGIILRVIRWYCKNVISYRELQEMLAERGVNVDHPPLSLGPALCA